MLQQHEKYTFPVSPGTMGGIFHLPLRKPIIESIFSISYHIITRVIMNSIDMIYNPCIDRLG